MVPIAKSKSFTIIVILEHDEKVVLNDFKVSWTCNVCSFTQYSYGNKVANFLLQSISCKGPNDFPRSLVGVLYSTVQVTAESK